VDTNGLSITPHVQHLATSSAQILYALNIMRACTQPMQDNNTGGFPFCNFSQHGGALLELKIARQKVYSFLRRSARVGFYSSDLASFDDLCIQADENLFNKVLHNPDHVLHRLLPPVAPTSYNYNLRPHAHDRSLPERLTHLTDCNFIIRMLFYQVY